MAVLAMVAIPSLTGTVTSGLDDGIAAVPAARSPNADYARRYDPYAQRLTEGIVLAIAGSGPSRASLAERVAGGPSSTDRQDRQRAVVDHPLHPKPPPRHGRRTGPDGGRPRATRASRKEQCFGQTGSTFDTTAPIATYTAPTPAPDGPDWEVQGPS